MTVSAAVIGLGHIGSRFDEEPGRATVWSHVGAYRECADMIRLVAAAEPLEGNRAAFHDRCPDVPVMVDAAELFEQARPDVVSICTPYANHPEMIEMALACDSVKVIWCEKPLAGSLKESESVVAACRARGVPLVVSHVRRWLPIWQRMSDRIERGDIGKLVTLRIAIPNRLFSIGSHAVDLVLMLGGRATDLVALPVPSLNEDNEPAVAALIGLEGGAYSVVQITGRKTDLVIEAEAFGSEGRLIAREDEGTLRLEKFVPSARYSNYRELSSAEVEQVENFDKASPFIAIAREVAALAQDPGTPMTCDGASALAVQQLLEKLSAVAGQPAY